MSTDIMIFAYYFIVLLSFDALCNVFIVVNSDEAMENLSKRRLCLRCHLSSKALYIVNLQLVKGILHFKVEGLFIFE